MSTILASASNADGATTTTSVFGWDNGNVVTATCTLSATTPPSQACQVRIEGSADNVNWYKLETKWFGLGAGQTYFAKFELSDYTDRASWFGLTGLWVYFRLVFSGNVGAAVTIAAVDANARQIAVIPLTATTSTGGGAVASWTPPEGGPVYIERAELITTTKSTGAATVTVGTAANATTSSGNLMTTADVGTALISYDNITNASTSGKAGQPLAAGSYVTATGSASTAGLVGNLIITYVKP
jgi:hypothetical protein